MKRIPLSLRLVCLLLPMIVKLYGQEANYFGSPINYDTRLSGSFAEPRSAHFHAGIDYKQLKGVPYDSIYAAADGYISRINVKPDGYGNALYIDHPNGYTTVYAHLHHFNKSLSDYIRSTMTQKKIQKIEHYPLKNKLVIKKGDFIGIMGNTGRSFGAHLHFEIRKTDSETPVNPALFGFKPKDNLTPTINGVVIYKLTPDGEVISKKYHPVVNKGGNRYSIGKRPIATDGLIIGIGIHAYDTMNGARNHNGVYGVNMLNNGREIYSFQMDSVSFDHSRYIHAHMDYEAKINNRYISKCYRLNTNPLEIYDTTLTTGTIITSDLFTNNISIEVYDFEGNQAEISFDIQRENTLTVKPEATDSVFQRYTPNDTIRGHSGPFNWIAAPGIVDKPEYLSFSNNGDTLSIEAKHEVPFFKYLTLTYSNSVELAPKSFIATADNKGKLKSLGCNSKDLTTLQAHIIETGKYWLATDSIPPSIQMISLPGPSSNRIKFKMLDNYEAVFGRDQLKFEVFIDGEWILCQHDIKDNTVWCDVTYVAPTRDHQILILVEDSCANQGEWTGTVRF